MSALALFTGSKAHPLADRGLDLYETPDVAVHALMRAERLPWKIWEPACGPGAIVRELRAAGHDVVASDIRDWACPDSEGGVNFLMVERAPPGVSCILTNPPFHSATEFVEHALTLVPNVIMLLRLAFLESKRRTAVLESGRLAHVHVFRKRLPMMHRHAWAGPRASSAMAFGWFCWTGEHAGPPTLSRI